ncbi:hypothetical protein ACHAWF_012527 [Thalassiosira exigua]
MPARSKIRSPSANSSGCPVRIAIGSTTGTIGEDEAYGDSATVRVQHHNQHDGRLLNKWWLDKMRWYKKQQLFQVLIREECGMLMCDTDSKPLPSEYDHLV